MGLDTIALSSWIQNLERTGRRNHTDATNTPAVTLLDFFRGLLDHTESISGIDVSKAVDASSSMRCLEPVTVAMMDNWTRQWGYN